MSSQRPRPRTAGRASAPPESGASSVGRSGNGRTQQIVRQSLMVAALTVGLGFLGSRLLGVLRTTVIANEFGTSAELDAYFVAFRIPDLIFQVLAGATLGSAFIPVFARLWFQRGGEDAWRLASAVLNTVTIATGALALLALVLAPWVVPLIAPGLGEGTENPAEVRDLAVEMTQLMLISPVLFAVSGMVMAMLNARHHFLLPSIAPMMYNLAIIGGAVLLADSMGVRGLAVGAVAGSGLHLLVQLPGLVKQRMRYSFVLRWWDPAVREVAKLMAPRVIGLAAVQANFVIITFFASDLGPSYISSLNYAWLLQQLPLGLFGIAISTAVFPRLAEHAARAETAQLRSAVASSLRFILFLTVPAAAGLMLLREPIVGIVLQRGAFGPEDTYVTSWALFYLAIGLPAAAGIEILSRGFYAVADTRTPVAMAVGSMLLNLTLAAIFVQFWDYRGLALALSLASTAEALALYVLLRQRLGGGIGEGLGMSLYRCVAATSMMAAVILLAMTGLEEAMADVYEGSQGERAVLAVVGILAGGAMFVAVAGLLRAPEIEMGMRRLEAFTSRLSRRQETAYTGGEDPY